MDEQHSGRLSLGSWALRGRPAVPEDLRPVLITRGVENLSRLSLASVRGPPMSTSSPGRLALVSEGPRCPPALPGDSRSRQWPALSTSSPGRLGPMPEVLRAQPDVPGDLGPCSSACGVEELSRATRARVRWPAQSTKSHERHVLGSVDSRGRQVLPVDSGSGRGLTGSTSSPGRLGPMPEVLWAQPDVPGDLGPCSSACGNDQLCRATRAWARGPTGSTSSPG